MWVRINLQEQVSPRASPRASPRSPPQDGQWLRKTLALLELSAQPAIALRDLPKAAQLALSSSSRYLMLPKGRRSHHESCKFQLSQSCELCLPSKSHEPTLPTS